MNELKIFEHPEFGEIRTVEIDGEPWMVGKDVATAFGDKNHNRSLGRLYNEDKRVVPLTDSMGRTQKVTVINESGLYALLFAMQPQKANHDEVSDAYPIEIQERIDKLHRFKRWVTGEVLPSIRKNGGYIAGQESMTPEELMAAALVVAQKTIENQKVRLSALTVENQIMQPKADYFDEMVDRNLLTNFRDTAKQLQMKQNSFIAFLLEKKYLYRDKSGKLSPYQQHIDNGLFELKECFNDKTGWAGTQTLITPRGRETFRLLCVSAA